MAKKRKSTGWKTFIFFLILSFLVGAAGRFTDLGKKPMHTDEAVLATKTQEFVESNFFKYDPTDHHGPFLHYATRSISSVKGWNPADLDETQLRYVIAIFGMGLLVLPFLLTDVLGKMGATFASLLLAVSPMLTYYSRYYIMEIPFAFLIGIFLVSVWRWSQRQNPIWLLLGGVSLGLMHATKETFVINIVALVLAWVAVKFMGGSFENHKLRYSFKSKGLTTLITGAVVILLIGVLTSAWLFSNGFKDWSGVADSYRTYLNYLNRAGNDDFRQDWHYYLSVLFYRKDGFVWSEAFVGCLALIGVLTASFSKDIPKHQRSWFWLIALYTLLLLVIYSCIPYKTPWSILSVHFGLACLAGLAVASLYRLFEHVFFRAIITVVLLLGVGVTLQQTSRATDYTYPGQTRYAADPRNPYVLSHTSTNLVKLVDRVDLVAQLLPEDEKMSVDIIQKEHGWPLPWYFRHFKDVSYLTEVPDRIDAAVVVLDLDQVNQAETVVKNQHELLVEETFTSAPASKASLPPAGFGDIGIMSEDGTQPIPPLPPVPLDYEQSYYSLRPNVAIKLWVRRDLWDRLLEEEARRSPLLPN